MNIKEREKKGNFLLFILKFILFDIFNFLYK